MPYDPNTDAMTLAPEPPAALAHPATYSAPVIATFREIASDIVEQAWPGSKVLDPFAGVGGIHAALSDIVLETTGVELEPEWANQHERTEVGDATSLRFDDGTFDAVFTSPCYGNRMADTYDGRDGSQRRTYRISLGRIPSANSAAAMQWGEEYRALHAQALTEMGRVVRPGGFMVVNMSNHIRDNEVQRVVEWWVETMLRYGGRIVEIRRIPTRRYRYGENHSQRVGAEHVIVMQRP